MGGGNNMWIASKYGWFSIVNKPTEHDKEWSGMSEMPSINIRARSVDDLEALRKFADIKAKPIISPAADYCCRVIVSRQELARVMGLLALDVDYPNFKDMIDGRPDQAEKLSYYHEIWALMFQFQMERER